MNLVLTWCWKEWRAQRGLLVAYALLVFACLALGLWLAPRHVWFDESFGAHALTWFVAAGVLGVVLFAAPGLVRGEFGAKNDQFVRRLPGALAPSFAGKLLFLVLATAALPLCGLALGELYVSLRGASWHGLFHWWWDGSVTFAWPGVLVACGYALLLVPWIWAIGTWLPGGRMAVGGTVLFALVVGIGAVAALRQSPNIEKGVAWHWWLCYVPPAGAALAAVSWAKGRRGGGPLRSARLGLAAAALAFVPPAAWFAACAFRYHHPDLQHLVRFDVRGLSPDGRFALAAGAEHDDFATVPLRIDLATGAAEQLGGTGAQFGTELLRPTPLAMTAARRYWRVYDWNTWTEQFTRQEVFDLVTGTRTAIGGDPREFATVADGPLRAAIAAELRAHSPFAAPGGAAVWFEPGMVCFAADGARGEPVQRVPLPGVVTARPAGHGAWCHGKTAGLFDFAARAFVPDITADNRAIVVRGDVFAEVPNRARWQRTRAGASAPEPCPELDGALVLGLLDDDRLLCQQRVVRGARPRIFVFDVAAGTVTDLAWPADAPANGRVDLATPLGVLRSLLPRDPAGRIWLAAAKGDRAAFVLLDPATLALCTVLPHDADWRRGYHLLAWPDATRALVMRGAAILRVDVASGAAQQLFPRR